MWWEDMFHPMRDPGYAYTYKNLLSGNFSLARVLFARVGGFDATLRVHEDYELGYRLLQAGARFHFAEAAAGLHPALIGAQQQGRAVRCPPRAPHDGGGKGIAVGAGVPVGRQHDRGWRASAIGWRRAPTCRC